MHAEIVFNGTLNRQYQQREQRSAPPIESFNRREPGFPIQPVKPRRRIVRVNPLNEAVLARLRSHGAQTRLDLAKALQVEKSTIQKVVDRLLKQRRIYGRQERMATTSWRTSRGWIYRVNERYRETGFE